MAAPVRANRASMLRAGGRSQRPAVGTWAPASTRCSTFAAPPIVSPGSALNSRSRDKIANSRVPISRIPIRRTPDAQTRNTSPARGNPLKGPSTVSSCSLPDKKAEDDKASKQSATPPRLTFLTQLMAAKKKKLGTKPDRSHQRVIELNRMRAFESQKKKLEHLQSEFMHKLRSMGPTFHGKAEYKFVAVVINDECKVVVNQDDLLRLPKNLPTESINDLKHRCRAIVDLGFVIFYDYIPFIQKAKNEFEAREKREEIRTKLSSMLNKKMNSLAVEIDQLCGPGANRPEATNNHLYREMAELRSQKQHMEARYFDTKKEHCEEMNKLRDEYERKLAVQLGSRDQTITELRNSLRKSEDLVSEQSIRLAEKNATLINEDGTIEELRSEMATVKSANQRMLQRLEEADVGLERARSSVEKHLGKITYLEGELQEARELIVALQKRPDVMDKGIMEKDLIIADLKLQLQNIEQHKNVLSKQVANALKNQSDCEDLSAKYKNAVVQISDLKEALKITTTKSDFHSKAEEQLRKEMAKMREQMDIDKQMLKARSDLINSLQKNELENRTKLDQMYYQISEKDTQINQVNNQLASKVEEFRNLFGTLTEKQTEVRRQEHVIQLLKEQNSRVSLTRASQDERNAAMEEEIKVLKKNVFSLTLGLLPTEGNEY
ncbi:ERC protein 2 isoform X2 [Drosophila takahashii]|uniref:ERC protein 2 isoform X2 n=1 Tax=Drosophila takahashii TaxID=29030 RepID=UPI003898EAC8